MTAGGTASAGLGWPVEGGLDQLPAAALAYLFGAGPLGSDGSGDGRAGGAEAVAGAYGQRTTGAAAGHPLEAVDQAGGAGLGLGSGGGFAGQLGGGGFEAWSQVRVSLAAISCPAARG
jgi:hypothetical protein